MVRQERAEATREAVLEGAASVFARLGYANASLSEIITESHVTKGALYFHFGSKEELARAVIDAGCAHIARKSAQWMDSRTPALEAIIGISCIAVETAAFDLPWHATLRLLAEIGDYRGSDGPVFDEWNKMFESLVESAAEDEDLRPEIATDQLARLLLAVLGGVRLVAAATDSRERVASDMNAAWSLMLPVLVPDSKVDYFRQFAARRLRV
ncbi:ScbR family autoregulator-binding transcription factor [Rhodococcus sp. NPDC058521]|uniref:ScbR family autoregulator-binding transcription factor n=1 Tax=Rhodococcus sp. NPDC058521 TaxID=3346536 RepID=UPI003659A026